MEVVEFSKALFHLKRGNEEPILNYAGNAITLIDLNTRKYIGANEDAKTVLNRWDIKGVHLWDITVAKYHAEQERSFEQLVAYGLAQPRKKENYAPDGSLLQVTVFAKVIKTPSKRVIVTRLQPAF